MVAVGFGPNDSIAYSDDNGKTWEGLGKDIFTNLGLDVAWNGSMWVAVGLGTTHSIAISYDGITWQGRGKDIFTTRGYDVAWNGSMWVAVGEGTNDTIAISYDGMNWTGRGKDILTTYGSRCSLERFNVG